jgi:hypothetical protein
MLGPFCCANHILTSETTKARWSTSPRYGGGCAAGR